MFNRTLKERAIAISTVRVLQLIKRMERDQRATFRGSREEERKKKKVISIIFLNPEIELDDLRDECHDSLHSSTGDESGVGSHTESDEEREIEQDGSDEASLGAGGSVSERVEHAADDVHQTAQGDDARLEHAGDGEGDEGSGSA